MSDGYIRILIHAFNVEGYDPESTPWRPKWKVPTVQTEEDWELTVERLAAGLGPASWFTRTKAPF